MENNYKKITIDQIPDNIDFEGYYWYSNERKPEIIDGEKIDKSIFSDLPFVVEANFYSEAEKISIQVKNIDGQYHVGEIKLESIENAAEYIAHDLKGINKFKMVETWEEKEDDKDNLLEGMKVLVPSWTAFAGFIRN
jgi:CRISPR type III-associated protein (TIGR04423 family)